MDVNAEDHDGWTPLHAAAHWGQEEACKLLVEHNCDMLYKNKAVRALYIISLFVFFDPEWGGNCNFIINIWFKHLIGLGMPHGHFQGSTLKKCFVFFLLNPLDFIGYEINVIVAMI